MEHSIYNDPAAGCPGCGTFNASHDDNCPHIAETSSTVEYSDTKLADTEADWIATHRESG